MIVLIWFLNLVISAFNAWGCGKSWTETKHVGGWAHFMNWMGAIMSASGFTWCYTILACLLGGSITHTVDGKVVPYLSPQQVEAVASAGYLIVIFPIIGSGIAIMIHSWRVFAERRSLGNGAVAGYNTFANAYNIYNAARGVPSAWEHVTKLFKGNDSKGNTLVAAIALFALFAGVLTTYTIISTVARSTAMDRALKQAMKA
jgi:hypothetical protein